MFIVRFRLGTGNGFIETTEKEKQLYQVGNFEGVSREFEGKCSESRFLSFLDLQDTTSGSMITDASRAKDGSKASF